MRALRRHHRERVQKARKGYWIGDNDRKKLGKLAKTPCWCSCCMCRNKRWINGRTVQELRQAAFLEAE